MHSLLLDDIKKFTVEEFGKGPENVTEQTGLERDLGIYGDDATEYIVMFGKQFGVDVSKFLINEYFSAEGLDLLSFSKRPKGKTKELLVGHLIKSIQAVSLDEDVINR